MKALALVGLAVAAQTALGQQPKVGTVVLAHGGDSAWNDRVLRAANEARTGGPVEVAFLMGPAARQSPVQEIVGRLVAGGATRVVFVPLLVSSHSGHYDQVRYLAGDSVVLGAAMAHHLEMSGLTRSSTNVPISVTRALDAAPEIAHVIAERALSLAERPQGRALLILGHGPNSAEDYAAWMANLRKVADAVRGIAPFEDVRVELVRDDAPAAVRAEAVLRTRELIELQHRATGQAVVVVPLLISSGAINRDKFPADLQGLPIEYSGQPLLPHPQISRWIERMVRSAVAGCAAAKKDCESQRSGLN